VFIKSAINYICYFVSHNLVASAENKLSTGTCTGTWATGTGTGN